MNTLRKMRSRNVILSEEEEDLRMRNEDKGDRRKNEEDAIDTVTLCGFGCRALLLCLGH